MSGWALFFWCAVVVLVAPPVGWVIDLFGGRIPSGPEVGPLALEMAIRLTLAGALAWWLVVLHRRRARAEGKWYLLRGWTAKKVLGAAAIAVLAFVIAINHWLASRVMTDQERVQAARDAEMTEEKRQAAVTALEQQESARKSAAAREEMNRKALGEEQLDRGILRYFKDKLRDPASFDLIYARRYGDTLCIEYRARNGFGGLNIERKALGRKMLEEMDFARACVGTYEDVTYLKKSL